MRYLVLFAAVILAGCGARGALATTAPTANPSVVASTDADVQAVSLAATAGIAGDGLAKCAAAAYASHVAGIGIVAHGTLVKDYVALSGKEPELMTADPAFVVQYSGTIRELSMGPGSPGWIDITDAICVAIDGTPFDYVTGPWVDSTGASGIPPAGPYDTKDLPAPLP